MRYDCRTVQGQVVPLQAPVSVKLHAHEDAPADDLSVVFPVLDAVPKIATVRVYHDGLAVFSGIVDEQITQVNHNGAWLKLVARSRAALLLDNEALPQQYVNPSLTTLFKRHVAPYGFCGFLGNPAPFDTRLTVTKGMSQWQVIEEFCIRCFNFTPVVTPDDWLDCSGDNPKELIIFDNVNPNGVKYSSLTHRDKFYKRISRLYLQPKSGRPYTSVLDDKAAQRMGVVRCRFVVSNNFRGKRMLNAAKRRAEEFLVGCSGGICARLRMPAVVQDAVLGTVLKLSVAGWNYSLDAGGEWCEYILRKEEI